MFVHVRVSLFFVCLVGFGFFFTVMQGCLCGFLWQAVAVLSGMRSSAQFGCGRDIKRLTGMCVCVCVG